MKSVKHCFEKNLQYHTRQNICSHYYGRAPLPFTVDTGVSSRVRDSYTDDTIIKKIQAITQY